MTYEIFAMLLLATLSAPFIGILALFAYVIPNKVKDRKLKSRRIALLRARIRSLPLDEEALNKRLETFDKILAEVDNEKVKMEYLERLAKGKEVVVKEKKRKKEKEKPFDNEWYERESEEFYKYLLGIGYRSPSALRREIYRDSERESECRNYTHNDDHGYNRYSYE